MKQYDTVAMLLAGGQGSRLGGLTHDLAKPAVSFGGKYRIIDFPLSNCRYSNIHVVGVLTQYKPLVLNAYITTGAPWALDSLDGGVSILPPYMDMSGGNWYSGTADAVYQNIEFIDQYAPKQVIILSGDHIYKMDYQEIVKYNRKMNADATLAVMNVPLEEAHRFGILNADEQNVITGFDEKPRKPKSGNASMGVYVFEWNCLRDALIEDAADTKSEHDFGKNIIPKLLAQKKRLVAFEFGGYWKDIGTIDSYFEANMELLLDPPPFDLNDHDFPIYSNNSNTIPQIICENAKVTNSLVSDGCIIEGVVKNSIISKNVYVGKTARIEDSIIMHDVNIESGTLKKTIVSEGMVISGDTLDKAAGMTSDGGVRLIYNQQSGLRQ